MANTCRLLILMILSSVFFISGVAYAQSSSDSYYPEFPVDRDADMMYSEPAANFSSKGIQYGGWITPSFIMRGIKGDSTSLSIIMLRLWAKSYLWNDAYVYVRAKNTLLLPIDYSGYKTKNIFDLDLGFFDMQFLNKSLHIELGRKYFFLGTGLVLNGRADGGDFSFHTKYVDIRAFVAYTGLLNKDDNPYNLSSADYSDGAKRLFAGGSLATNLLTNHNIYLFGVNQSDFGDNEDQDYNSLYIGLGAKGYLFGRMSYYAEGVYETGKSYTRSLPHTKKTIQAFAINTGLDYRINAATSPSVLVQYAFGSGDGDRNEAASPAGNDRGNDTGFLSFGTFNGGYGLNPVIGNLHTIRVGFALNPLETLESKFFNRMTFIGKYSVYLKDKAEGNINAGEAKQDNAMVGHGIDASLRWMILSDLSFFMNYGMFIPGDAFPSEEKNRHFVLTGLNLSF